MSSYFRHKRACEQRLHLRECVDDVFPQEECTVSGQTAPIYGDNSTYPAYQAYPSHSHGPASGPGPSNLQCHMTTIHTAVAQAPPSGKTKWKVSKQSPSPHRYHFPPQQMQPIASPTPQVFFNNYPSGHVMPPTPATPYEPYYYGAQPYFPPGSFPAGNIYRPQVPSPPVPSPQPPRPYLTITQFNYQPVGYSQVQSQPSTTNLVFGPPPRDRRCGADSQCRFYQSQMTPYETERSVTSPRVVEHPKIIYPHNVVHDPHLIHEQSSKRTELKSNSSTSFEFTIPPEQIVNSLCDDKDQDCFKSQSQIELPRIPEESLTNNAYGTPRMWTECEFVDPLRIEDDELTKFIVDGCMKAEAIAVRNQHRPCFKNIKHLCTRTRTDILKPRTTVANIHSQGIPWATKDFIFAFVRLINCWYILKGYLDDHEGSLGKIEQALTPEFKECYQRWQTINKEMVKHLINIFVNLDNGISVQNAEIFSTFNQARKILSSCSLPCEDTINFLNVNDSKSCPATQLSATQLSPDNKSKSSSNDNDPDISQFQSNIDSYIDDKLKCSEVDGKSVPGILRVKNVFHNSSVNIKPEEVASCSTDNIKQHKMYMKPGSYRVPKKHTNTPVDTPRNSDTDERFSPKNFLDELSDNQEEELWKYALKSFLPFMRAQQEQAKKSGTNSTGSSEKDEEERKNNEEQTQEWVKDHFISTHQEVIEDLLKPSPRPKVPSGRKTIVSKTFRKRSEDPEKKTKIGELTTKTKSSRKKSLPSIFFLSERGTTLSQSSAFKFEKIINVLWHQKFAKFVTFEVNIESVPDFYKYITNPMFLYKVMNNLKQHKYVHPFQVVHDLRLIVRNAELYIMKRPDRWFEECLKSFSKELESQLALEFSAIDFSSITGDPLHPPGLELNIIPNSCVDDPEIDP